MKSIAGKLKRGSARIRTEGLFPVLLDYSKDWIRIIPFYYMKEIVSSDIPVHLTAIPEGFEFSVFDHEDVEAISKLEERKGYIYNQYVYESLDHGDTCIGIKQNGKIAAFTWYSLKDCRAWHYPATMKENEAYLYDMYVLKSFRGMNLAPILRYKNYEILRKHGRDTFYSITESSNAASLRFKQKLGAKIVFKGICIVFLDKYSIRWVMNYRRKRDLPGSSC